MDSNSSLLNFLDFEYLSCYSISKIVSSISLYNVLIYLGVLTMIQFFKGKFKSIYCWLSDEYGSVFPYPFLSKSMSFYYYYLFISCGKFKSTYCWLIPNAFFSLLYPFLLFYFAKLSLILAKHYSLFVLCYFLISISEDREDA